MRELKGKKVKGVSHSATGYVLSQVPDFKSGKGFKLMIAWDVDSLIEAEKTLESDLVTEHSDDVLLVEE